MLFTVLFQVACTAFFFIAPGIPAQAQCGLSLSTACESGRDSQPLFQCRVRLSPVTLLSC